MAPILLVEPDPYLRTRLTEYLEWQGFAVLGLAAADEALHSARSLCPALVLCGADPGWHRLHHEVAQGGGRFVLVLPQGVQAAPDWPQPDACLRHPYGLGELLALVRELLGE